MRTPPRPFRTIFVALFFIVAFSASQSVQAQAVGPGDVLFSEFRLSGPGGFADEYLELYCNRDAACDVSGFNLIAFDPSFGDFAVSFPAGVVIPARGHLLVGDEAGYSLAEYAGLDLVATFDGELDFFVDNEGVQLRNADQSIVIDSVGFIGEESEVTYIEGTGLQRATSRPADQYAYVRQQTSGRPQDTNNNSADFVLVSVTGAAHPGISQPPVLGAPGPENMQSPLQRNAAIKASLIDPSQSSSAPPNRVRTGSETSANAAYGTLTIRRRFTNNTGQTITRLRFRVVDITTLNSPGYASGSQADLRALNSGSSGITVNGNPVTVEGTSVETPPVQPNGGGLNSSLGRSSVAGTITNTFIAPGGTVDVQFVVGVQREGLFSFLVNIEATTSATLPAIQTKSARSRSAKGKASNTDLVFRPQTRMMSVRRAFLPSGLPTTQR